MLVDENKRFLIGLLQQTITWYMVVGKLIIIPAHWDIRTKASQASLAQVSLF